MSEGAKSNPAPPPGFLGRQESSDAQRDKLSNADFRELLKTPAVNRMAAPTPASRQHDDRKEKRKAYAQFYKQKKQQEDEHNKKYRDRAAERRKMEDRGELDADDLIPSASAQPHVLTSGQLVGLPEDIRRAEIEKTKFLGGDMEHTHLVKGLDYALLQKVKAEFHEGGEEGDDEEKPQKASVEAVELRTQLAKKIFNVLFVPPEERKNESFLPGRMAYRFELNDEYVDTDLPTTVLRSKAEIAHLQGFRASQSTNDIVVNKLTQIFAFLRQGLRGKKDKKKKGTDGSAYKPAVEESKPKERPPEANEDIFGDAGDYKPPATASEAKKKKKNRWGPSRAEQNGSGIDGEHLDIDGEAVIGPYPADSGGGDGDGNDVIGPYPADDSILGPYPGSHDDGVTAPYPDVSDNGVVGPYPGTDGAVGPYPPDAAAYQMMYAQQQSYMQAALMQQQMQMQMQAQMEAQPRELTAEEKARGMASVFKRDERALRREPVKDKKEKDANFVPDSYAECYPSAFETTQYAFNSEDEDDDPMAKMDTGKKSVIRRADFDDDEDFARAKQNEEAMPKAAFQYGMKMSDGRQTRRHGKAGKLDSKAKIDRDLNQINQMMMKRKAATTSGRDDSKRARED